MREEEGRVARTIDEVAERLVRTKPALSAATYSMRAAVALVLREADGDLEALFIRRAEHEGDPWSGHLAFPGGRIDPTDTGPRMAAERETQEELELDLSTARLLGQLSDVPGHAESICVSGFVYALDGDPVLKPNHEIRAAFWSPLDHLTDPARQARKMFTYLDRSMALPTVRLLDDERAPVLWGITYKFMDEFMARIGRTIPYMLWADPPPDFEFPPRP
jgi:8-oxo-dGTP pyrophosphatase MutT (NUDIX family)